MKTILYIFITLFFLNCKNAPKVDRSIARDSSIEDVKSNNEINNAKDTSSKTTYDNIHVDTLIKISKPFALNGLTCYWKLYITTDAEKIIELYEFKTNRILASHQDIIRFYETDFIYERDFNPLEYFNKINVDEIGNEYLVDLNFDGFEDFSFKGHGSTAMTDLTNIYLFDNKTHTFQYSEELSDNTIVEIDRTNRKLETIGFGMDYELTKKHYFDKKGKIKYTEVLTESYKFIDSLNLEVNYKTYEKVINGKVVETKRDSTISPE